MQHALPESNRNYGQEERRISSVLPYNALFSETERERGSVNYDNPSVADAGLVPQLARHVSGPSDPPSVESTTSYQPPGGITLIDREPNTNIGCMARIQQSLQSKGISSRLIVAAWWPVQTQFITQPGKMA